MYLRPLALYLITDSSKAAVDYFGGNKTYYNAYVCGMYFHALL